MILNATLLISIIKAGKIQFIKLYLIWMWMIHLGTLKNVISCNHIIEIMNIYNWKVDKFKQSYSDFASVDYA